MERQFKSICILSEFHSLLASFSSSSHNIVLLVECSPTNQVQEGPSGLLTALDGVTTQKDDDDDDDDDNQVKDEEYDDDEVEPGPPGIILKTEDLVE